MIKYLGKESLALAETVLVAQGEATYLADWEADMVQRLRSRPPAPGGAPIIVRAGASGIPERFRLRVTDQPGARRRNFAYGKLLAKSPELYRQHVILTPPEVPVVLTFARQALWDGYRSTGWEAAAQRYGTSREDSGATVYDVAARLSTVRAVLKRLGETESAARRELAELVASRGIRPYKHEDATMRAVPAKPKQWIDLDAAERDPVLSEFVTWSESKPYKRVWFEKVADDEDEGEFDL